MKEEMKEDEKKERSSIHLFISGIPANKHKMNVVSR